MADELRRRPLGGDDVTATRDGVTSQTNGHSYSSEHVGKANHHRNGTLPGKRALKLTTLMITKAIYDINKNKL